MSVVLPHIILTILGLPWTFFLRGTALAQGPSLVVTSYLLGEIIVFLLMQCSSFLLGYFAWEMLGITQACSLLVYFVLRRAVQPLQPKPLSYSSAKLWILFFALFVVAIPALYTSFQQPLLVWDARSVWFFRGKVFHSFNSIPQSFLTDPLYRWSHPDYPPFIALLSTFHAHFLATWDEVLCKSFLWLHYFSLLYLLGACFYFLTNSIVLAIFVALILYLQHWANALTGYADVFCALPFALANLCFLCATSSTKESQHEQLAVNYLLVSGAFLGLSAATKQEGLVFSLLSIFLASIYFLCRSGPRGLKLLPYQLLPLALISLPWLVFVSSHDIEGEYRLGLANIFAHSFSDNARRLLQVLSYPTDRGALFIYLGTCVFLLVLARRQIKLRVLSLFFLVHLLLLRLTVALMYLATPLDLGWHLSTASERTLTTCYMLSKALFCWAVWQFLVPHRKTVPS